MPPEFNIERPKQVIVEGVDDVRVMGALCEHLGIVDMQFAPCGGYNSLRQFLRAFRADPAFRQVQSLAVVVDADANPDGRRQGVADALTSAGLPNPRWVSKARVHAFLASRDRPDLRLGEAAERGIWRFESEAFRPLIDLLRML